MAANLGIFFLQFLCFSTVALSAIHSLQADYSCVYTVFVRTSKSPHSATDSKISLTLYDKSGAGILIKNLEAWGGAMEEGHDYFQKGNLDIFTGRGPCLYYPPCEIHLESDGSGSGSSWYCNYVEVTFTGPQTKCNQTTFTVEQWLATDHSPYKLTADVDYCSSNGRIRKPLLPVESLLAAAASSSTQ